MFAFTPPGLESSVHALEPSQSVQHENSNHNRSATLIYEARETLPSSQAMRTFPLLGPTPSVTVPVRPAWPQPPEHVLVDGPGGEGCIVPGANLPASSEIYGSLDGTSAPSISLSLSPRLEFLSDIQEEEAAPLDLPMDTRRLVRFPTRTPAAEYALEVPLQSPPPYPAFEEYSSVLPIVHVPAFVALPSPGHADALPADFTRAFVQPFSMPGPTFIAARSPSWEASSPLPSIPSSFEDVSEPSYSSWNVPRLPSESGDYIQDSGHEERIAISQYPATQASSPVMDGDKTPSSVISALPNLPDIPGPVTPPPSHDRTPWRADLSLPQRAPSSDSDPGLPSIAFLEQQTSEGDAEELQFAAGPGCADDYDADPRALPQAQRIDTPRPPAGIPFAPAPGVFISPLKNVSGASEGSEEADEAVSRRCFAQWYC
jgi:hypothetical protein